MLVFYTDFTLKGPYVGQMHAVAESMAPGIPRLDLMHDAPMFDPAGAGLLLSRMMVPFPTDTLIIAVVDPGVGSYRGGIAVQAGGLRFVGPDNGLLWAVISAQPQMVVWRLPPPAAGAAPTFHGRDWFTPLAVQWAKDGRSPGVPLSVDEVVQAPLSLPRILYADGFGNGMTGLDAEGLGAARLQVGDIVLDRVRTFSDLEEGQAGWLGNALGLAEIVCRNASAVERFSIGASVSVLP